MAVKPYKQRAKELKALGLINIDLRKALTPAQKGLITKRANQYKDVIKNPQAFAVKHISQKSAKVIDTDTARVKTKGGKVKVWIAAPKGTSVTVKKGVVIKQDKNYIEKIYPGGKNILKTAEKLFKKKLGRKEYVQIKIGKNSPISLTFTDLATLNNYISGWQPKDPKSNKDDLISHMMLVKVKNPSYMSDLDDDDLDEIFAGEGY